MGKLQADKMAQRPFWELAGEYVVAQVFSVGVARCGHWKMC